MKETKFNYYISEDQANFSNERFRSHLPTSGKLTYAHYNVFADDEFCVGHVTVAGLRVKNNLYYALSMCSPNDTFSKKDGRKFAHRHFRTQDSSKRGVYFLKEKETEEDPTTLFTKVVNRHLKKLCRRISWLAC